MPKIHLIERTLKVLSVDPNQVQREESQAFREAKERLRQDGHYVCYVCGKTEEQAKATGYAIESHHFGCEWQYADIVDFEKLKEYLLQHDIYGYSRLLQHQPLISVDDVRNQMALCTPHHRLADKADGGTGTGAHDLDAPTWTIQIVCKDGMNPVPQEGETAEQVLQRIEAALGAEKG
jgi:hypothetical protein